MVRDFDGFPVEEIGGFFALDFAHEAAAGVGAGIGGWLSQGGLELGRVPKAVAVSHG